MPPKETIPLMSGPVFIASRDFALDRLAGFVPRAGRDYAAGRNTDPGPDEPGAVSRLSPFLRYRIVSEQEVVSPVITRHGVAAAEKFIHEVLWRTYWKGWLEMRPGVWRRFLAERDIHARNEAVAIREAEAGRTGIDCFDHWVGELKETGYLHNHARMWFASIWIFTLRLPWTLGADFFLRHLIDADPASNTLSWRWVAGLHTPGKIYLATAENIARYTQGRFAPRGLAVSAEPVAEATAERPSVLASPVPADPSRPAILLVTHEDLHPAPLLEGDMAFRSVAVACDAGLLWGDGARRFVTEAAADTAQRICRQLSCSASVIDRLDVAALLAEARSAGATQIVTPYAPVGPVADALLRLSPELAREGISLVTVRRSWDAAFWPHAKKGFFAFKEHIPGLLNAGGLA